MQQVKKSVNIPEDLAKRIDSFVENNAGTSFTFVVVQALECWLKNPKFHFAQQTESKDRTSTQENQRECEL